MSRMENFSLCYFGAREAEIIPLSVAARRFHENSIPVHIYARTASQLFDESRRKAFVRKALESSYIIVTLFGERSSFPALDALITALNEARNLGLETPVLHIQPITPEADTVLAAEQFSDLYGTEQWNLINEYHRHGGPQNLYNMILGLYSARCGLELQITEPVQVPCQGIYHPDFPNDITLENYLSARKKPGRPTIGMWFYQGLVQANDLEHIDAIIRTVESMGANVIPVFHIRRKDAALGNMSVDEVARTFFFRNGVTAIDALINLMPSSLGMESSEWAGILPELGVPAIQAIVMTRSREVWNEGFQGLPSLDIPFLVAQPEFDGVLITVPVASKEEADVDPFTGALIHKKKPIPERISRMVSLAIKWAGLRHKSNKDKKIAVVFHNYPPRNDRIGAASGLDSFESVRSLLQEMSSRGFTIDRLYESGDELARELLSRLTCDKRWLLPEQICAKAEVSVNLNTVNSWTELLPDTAQLQLKEHWGTPSDDSFLVDDTMYFPGLLNGNVFLTIQPVRGDLDKAAAGYHDMFLPPPYQYLFHYKWIRDVFKADSIAHIGKHGTLEWLPGKSVGLGDCCYPDMAIGDIPNIYPYIINDPSEGTQAKRRSYCVIVDHLPPPLTNADLYEDLAQIEILLKDYEDARREDSEKLPVIGELLWQAVTKAHLDNDLNLSHHDAAHDMDGFACKLHDYLDQIADTTINDGLHILGQPPEDKRLIDFLFQLTRLSNGETPSLRESVADLVGQSDVIPFMSGSRPNSSEHGEPVAGMARKVNEIGLELLNRFHETGYEVKDIRGIIIDLFGRTSQKLEQVLTYIAVELLPRVRLTTKEMDSVLDAFEGVFIEPGPAGAPTRGQADILPTGRNFFTLDPRKIPSPAAWEVGKRLGDSLIQRFMKEKGKFPETVGMIIWGGSTMRSKGDDVAEVLYLLGVKPVWNDSNGNVTGLEIIPLSELNRPRIDVVPRTSGFFRDAFPCVMQLMDDAVKMVAALNESHESNFLRKHVVTDMQVHIGRGTAEQDAFREATFRVFSCPPGSYGAGVKELVETRNWKSRDELGAAYINYSSHAYGDDCYGDRKPDTFRKLLSRVDITFKNEDSREKDMLCCTDYYNYYGGLISAVGSVKGQLPMAVVGDSSDPMRISTRTTSEEASRIFRARLLNPKWIDGMKRHGYKGAGEISKAMDIAFGWDATAEVVEDWMYESLANKIALDKDIQEWMNDVNPHALQNILDKLLEAIQRGMWDASEDMEDQLREEYLEIEGVLEEMTE